VVGSAISQIRVSVAQIFKIELLTNLDRSGKSNLYTACVEVKNYFYAICVEVIFATNQKARHKLFYDLCLLAWSFIEFDKDLLFCYL